MSEDLQQQIEDLECQVSDLEGDNTDLSDEALDLKDRIKELEAQLGWHKVSESYKIPEGVPLLVRIDGKPHIAKLSVFRWQLICMHSNHPFECDLTMIDEWKRITSPKPKGDK